MRDTEDINSIPSLLHLEQGFKVKAPTCQESFLTSKIHSRMDHSESVLLKLFHIV